MDKFTVKKRGIELKGKVSHEELLTICFRNQENKDSPKVKRSRTDDIGHLLNRNIISDVGGAATAVASPTVTPFSTSIFFF